MNFAETVNEVVLTVKRPDLIGQVRREVNSAITFYCLDNEFASDYVEQVIELDANEYTQSFAKSLMTRFRRFKYLKRGGTNSFLDKMSDAEMRAGCGNCDKYYEIGVNVNISLKALARTLDVGFWTYPPVLSGEGTFWLLDLQPYIIIDRACAAVFRIIGDEKSMSAHAISARESYLAARKDLLTGQ